MKGSESRGERMAALFLLGLLLLSPPLLAIVAVDALVLGIPLLYVYLFAVWGLLILLLAWLSRRTGASAAAPGQAVRDL